MQSYGGSEFYKSLFRLSVPIALEGLIAFCVGALDSVMVGRLGDTNIGGVYMGSQTQMLLQVFSVGVEGAILAICAQYWGRQDTEKIRKITATGVLFSVSVGLVLTIVCISFPSFVVGLFTDKKEIIDTGAGYIRILSLSFPLFCLSRSLVSAMRSVENTRIGFVASGVGLILKLLMNYMLILGNLGMAKMGIRGAAVSTLAARAAEALILTVYALFIDKRLSLRVKSLFRIDLSAIKEFFGYGTPIIAGQLVWAINTLSGAAIIGRSGTAAVSAAFGVANTLNGLAYVFSSGISSALGIITGKTVGAGECENVKKNTKRAQILFIIIGALTGIAIQLAKLPFISLYTLTPSAAAEAKAFINVLSLTAVMTSYQSACLFGILKNGGDSAFVFKVEALSVFCAVLPAALIALRLDLSPTVVFIALKCDQPIKCIPAAIRVNGFGWMKNITQKEKRLRN